MGLRKATLESIKKTIDQSEFSRHLFEITTDDDSLLDVEFKMNSNISFKIRERSKIELTDGSIQAGYHDPADSLIYKTLGNNISELMTKPQPAKIIYYYETIEAPGKLASIDEIYESDSLQTAIQRISKWLNRVYEDLQPSDQTGDDLETLREEMESQLNLDDDSNNGFFEENEKHVLYKQLDELKNKLKQLYAEQKESDNTISSMKEQLSKLQNNIGILDKRTWRLNSFNKIFELVSKAVKFKKNLQKLKENINFLLGDDSIQPIDNEVEEDKS